MVMTSEDLWFTVHTDLSINDQHFAVHFQDTLTYLVI